MLLCENCGEPTPARGTTKRFCSRRCKKNASRRRLYATDPEWRARERARANAVYHRTDVVTKYRNHLRRHLRDTLRKLEEHGP